MAAIFRSAGAPYIYFSPCDITGSYQLLRVFISAAAVVILSTGCASPPKYDFVKEGASKFEKQNAFSECSYQIQLNKTPAAEQGNLRNLCMQGKGYRYKQVG